MKKTGALNKLRELNRNNRWFWISAILVAFSYAVISTLFRYEDSISFTVWSVEFWDSLFAGNIRDFYAYASENIRGAVHGAPQGSYLTFFPWILWNLPTYLLHINSDVTGMSCILWNKLFLVLMLGVLCVYVYKIVKACYENLPGNADSDALAAFAAMLTAGSIEMLDSIAFAGQDEVVYLATFFVAFYGFLSGKKKTAIIFGIITVTICPIMLIPMMVLFLLYEKRIWMIICNAVLLLAPTFLFELIYRNDAIYNELKVENTLGIFQLMMNSGTMQMTVGNTSIPTILLIILLFICFICKKTGDELKREAVIYLALSFMLTSFFMYAIYYRFCMYIPIFAILVVLDDNVPMKALLFVITGISRFLCSFINYYNFNYLYSSSIFTKLTGRQADGLFIDAASPIYDTLSYLLRPLSVAAGLLIVLLCVYRKFPEIGFPKKYTWVSVAQGAILVLLTFALFVL